MTFTNPTGYWGYNGAYVVLLTDDTATDRLPAYWFMAKRCA